MWTRWLNALAVGVLVSSLGFCSQASGQSGIITTVAGNLIGGFAGDGGSATSASLNYPAGVTVDAFGNLFIADSGNNRIRKVSPGGIITTVAGNGISAFASDGGLATSARLSDPYGVAVDTSGNLFIADTFNNRIREVLASGTIKTVAGNGVAGFAGDGAAATLASLYQPQGVTVDASGNLFIADSVNGRIRKVSANGTITTVAGGGALGDGVLATSASLLAPWGVAVDASGNLFIADLTGNRIRRVSADGIITTVAGTGVFGFAGDGGAATSALLGEPASVAVDISGNLFIADRNTSRIRKVSASGIITTVAGGGTGGSGDGVPAISAILFFPNGVAVDASGNLFIADSASDRIRKVSAVPAPSGGSPVAIPLPAAVNTVDVNPNTNQVYVGGNINNVVQNIVWIDGNTNGIVKSLGVGQGLHVNPATNKIYAADLYGGHILVYSGSDGSLLKSISTFGCPVEAVVDTQLNHIWGGGQCGGGNDPAFLIDGGTDTVISGYIGSGGVMGGYMVVNPATHAFYMSVGGVEKEVNASTFAVTNAPFSAAVVTSSPLAASLYGADATGKNVVVINYGTESVVTTLPVSQTGAIAVNPTRNRIYAVDLSVSPPVIKVFAGGNSLSGSNTLIGSIPLRSGDQPCCTMAVNSTSGTIYLPVVNAGSPFLLVIADTLASSPVGAPVLTSLSPSTAVAGAGALTLTVNGSGFVSGSVVQWNGAALATTFVNATQLTAAVPASDLASAGVAEVNVNNPGLPTSDLLSFTIQASVGLSITSIAPTSAAVGGGAFTLTVNGTGFSPSLNSLQGPIPGSVVQWNGAALQTTFISSTQLTAAVPASDLASAGTAQVTVANGASTTSNALPFTISQTASSYTGCNGQPATGNLQLSIISLNASTGVVQINGLDSRAPNTPFTWNWGDGATTQGFFPQSHTYSNLQLNFSLQVTSHENDGSTDCAQLSIIFHAQTAGSITSVTTADAGPVIAQNDFIVIKGTNLVPANTPAAGAIWSSAPSFASGLMPTQLGGVSVTVNSKPAFVYFYCSAATDPACTQDQLNILTPLDSTTGPVPVVVTNGGISGPTFTVNMQAVAPSFLLFSTAGYIVAMHANSTLVGPTSLYPGSSTPASPGETIGLYAVGFGLPTTPLVNGSASQSGPLSVLPVCQVGGTAAAVTFAGLTGAGVYQLNLTIPATVANGDNAVSCTYNGATTPAGDLITVQSSTPPNPTLTITTSGTGSGTVSSSPTGTSCGSGCLSFAAGTVVTLTATPNTGSTFAGWSGACSGTASCTVTMNSNQAVNATFNLASSTGNGITISSISSASPTPLTILQIGTSGVNAANPVTLQFSNSAGFSATEQAVRVQSDGTVIAGVPLYIDPSTGQIGPGAVSLVLTQGTLSSAPTSIAIQDLPLLSTYGTQLGQISDASLIFEALLHARRLNEFQAAQPLVGGSVNTLSAQTTMEDLLSASILARADVDTVMSNNGTVISWGSLADGTHLQFDSTQLDVMDRIAAIYLTQQFLSPGGVSAPSPPSLSLLGRPLSTHGASIQPQVSFNSMASLLACLGAGTSPCFMQAQEAVQSSPNATDTSAGWLTGLKSILSQAGAEHAAGVAGVALAYAHLGTAMDSLTHGISDAAAFLGSNSGDEEAIQNEISGAGAAIVASITEAIGQVPVMLGLVAEQQTFGIISKSMQSVVMIAKDSSSGQITGVDSTSVSLVSPSTLPQLSGHLAYVTGTVENASSQGATAAQSGLDLCCFGASKLGITGLTDPGGSYYMLAPIGVAGTNYAALTMSATDPLSGVSFGSEVVNLTGLNTSNPVQIPPVPTGSTPPTGGGTIPPGTYSSGSVTYSASVTGTLAPPVPAETCSYSGTLQGNATVTVTPGGLPILQFNGTETWNLTYDSGYPSGTGTIYYSCSTTTFSVPNIYNSLVLSVSPNGSIGGSLSVSGLNLQYSGSLLGGNTISGTYTFAADSSGTFNFAGPATVTFQGPLNLVLQ